MFLGPFPTAAAIERLAERATSLRVVGGASDLRAAIESPPATAPAGYVVVEERSEPARSGGSGHLRQACFVTLQAVLFVRNAGAARAGADKRKAMDALITEVRGAWLNWIPAGSPSFHAVRHLASRDEYSHGSHLVSQEIFATQYTIEVTS